MTDFYPALIAVVPLTAGALSPFVTRFHREAGRLLVTFALFISFLCSLGMLTAVAGGEVFHYWFGGWDPPYGLEYVIDSLNAFIITFVTFVAFVACIYAKPFTDVENRLKVGTYYTLFALLCAGLYGQVITGDVFNFYVFLEISSLAGYGLIALGGKRAPLSAFRYLLVGTIGASCYLLGVGYLYAMTGTLNMADLADRVAPLMGNPAVLIAISLIFVGLGVKMALFPFHGWQPDAYTDAHPGAAPVIAGIMGKVPIYAMMRYFIFIFGVSYLSVQTLLSVAGVLACIGIIYGSVLAIAQKDFRRMLAYSSVAQIGYIVLGIAIGNVYGLIGAVLHLVAHAFAKSAFFMAAGNIRYRFGEVNITKFGQIYKAMPVTGALIVVASLSMIGIPPTGGFFSKWYLLLGAWENDQIVYAVVLIVSSLLNAIYFFRLIESIYIKPAHPDVAPKARVQSLRFETPLRMVVATAVMGIGIIAIGLFNEPMITAILNFAWPGGM